MWPPLGCDEGYIEVITGEGCQPDSCECDPEIICDEINCPIDGHVANCCDSTCGCPAVTLPQCGTPFVGTDLQSDLQSFADTYELVTHAEVWEEEHCYAYDPVNPSQFNLHYEGEMGGARNYWTLNLVYVDGTMVSYAWDGRNGIQGDLSLGCKPVSFATITVGGIPGGAKKEKYFNMTFTIDGVCDGSPSCIPSVDCQLGETFELAGDDCCDCVCREESCPVPNCIDGFVLTLLEGACCESCECPVLEDRVCTPLDCLQGAETNLTSGECCPTECSCIDGFVCDDTPCLDGEIECLICNECCNSCNCPAQPTCTLIICPEGGKPRNETLPGECCPSGCIRNDDPCLLLCEGEGELPIILPDEFCARNCTCDATYPWPSLDCEVGYLESASGEGCEPDECICDPEYTWPPLNCTEGYIEETVGEECCPSLCVCDPATICTPPSCGVGEIGGKEDEADCCDNICVCDPDPNACVPPVCPEGGFAVKVNEDDCCENDCECLPSEQLICTPEVCPPGSEPSDFVELGECCPSGCDGIVCIPIECPEGEIGSTPPGEFCDTKCVCDSEYVWPPVGCDDEYVEVITGEGCQPDGCECDPEFVCPLPEPPCFDDQIWVKDPEDSCCENTCECDSDFVCELLDCLEGEVTVLGESGCCDICSCPENPVCESLNCLEGEVVAVVEGECCQRCMCFSDAICPVLNCLDGFVSTLLDGACCETCECPALVEDRICTEQPDCHSVDGDNGCCDTFTLDVCPTLDCHPEQTEITVGCCPECSCDEAVCSTPTCTIEGHELMLPEEDACCEVCECPVAVEDRDCPVLNCGVGEQETNDPELCCQECFVVETCVNPFDTSPCDTTSGDDCELCIDSTSCCADETNDYYGNCDESANECPGGAHFICNGGNCPNDIECVYIGGVCNSHCWGSIICTGVTCPIGYSEGMLCHQNGNSPNPKVCPCREGGGI
jgi:hypothetical protein